MRRVVFRHNGKFRQSNIYHRTNLANPQQQPQTRNVRVTLAGAEPLRLETTAEIPKLSAEANRVPWPRPRFALEAELQRKFPNFAAVVEAPVMVLLRSRAGLRRRGGRRVLCASNQDMEPQKRGSSFPVGFTLKLSQFGASGSLFCFLGCPGLVVGPFGFPLNEKQAEGRQERGSTKARGGRGLNRLKAEKWAF